jgi:hypothetical protein
LRQSVNERFSLASAPKEFVKIDTIRDRCKARQVGVDEQMDGSNKNEIERSPDDPESTRGIQTKRQRDVAMNQWSQAIKNAFALFGVLFCLISATSYGAANVEVYVAYAENVHLPQVFMPNPWYGSPNTIFLGYPTSPPAGGVLAWNTGGILIRNAGAAAVVLGPRIRVDGFNSVVSFTLWDSTGSAGDGLLGSSGIGPSGITIPAGQQVILAQTGASRNSATDFNSSPCTRATPTPLCSSNFATSATPAGETGATSMPVIHLTLNGVTQTFTDTAQVLNTAGTNFTQTPGAINQSVQWRLIGTTGPYLPGGSGVNPPPVTTWHNDNSRTGLDASETTLNPQDVNCVPRGVPCNFGKLFVYPVIGAINAQPLFVPNVLINGAKHNVVFVSTTSNNIYAFDAESAIPVNNGQPLWMMSFGSTSGGFQVESTPVIDTTTNTLYVVTNSNGTAAVLHALDLGTGQEKVTPPTVIGGAVLGLGDNSCCGNPAIAQIAFNVKNSLPSNMSNMAQRPALLFYSGSVYVAFGSGGDSPPYHGWLFGYNAANISQPTEIFNSTPMANSTQDQNYHGNWNLAGGGFWMGGAGPAADATGIFATTGNGCFNNGSVATATGGCANTTADYGDSILRLIPPSHLLPPPPQFPQLWPMKVADYFTPFDQAWLACNDSDFGSSGPLLIPKSNPPLLVQASKSGRIYLLNRASMGNYHASCTAPGGPPCEPIVQVIDQAIGIPASGTPPQDTPTPWCASPPNPPGTAPWFGVVTGSPAYFNDTVFFKAANDSIKAFQLVNGQFVTTPVAQSANNNDGSATPSISYDSTGATSTGIVWTLENQNSQAVLNAYTASNLQQLYTSGQLPSDLAGPAVNLSPPPTIAAGKVFVATTNQLVVYGAGLAFPLQTDALNVTLQVVPAPNQSRFNVLIDGAVQLSSAVSGATTGPLQVAPGKHGVSASLVAASYGFNNQYSISYTGNCTAGGVVTLQPGASPATCTVVAKAISCPSGEYWNSTAGACESHSGCPANCKYGCDPPEITPSGPVWNCKSPLPGCPTGFTYCGPGPRGGPICVKPPDRCP